MNKQEATVRERLGGMSLAQIKELRRQSGKQRLRANVPALVPQERGNTAPLSYAQERLWFLDQLGFVGPTYNMPMALRLQGALHLRALERSLGELIRRHESLRTRFRSIDGTPCQVIDPPAPVVLEVQDLTRLAQQEKDVHVERTTVEEAQRPFDLCNGPLFRTSLLKLADNEHVLLMTLHHIVSDGWSLSVLNHEIGALYSAYSSDSPSPISEAVIQYADYAIWQRGWLQGQELEHQLSYWKSQLKDAPTLQLPIDYPRPPKPTFKGGTVPFALPADISRKLADIARGHGATLYMVLLSAFQMLLARYSGQEDIVVGSPIAGRKNRELEGLIGFFVNTLVMRTDISGNPTFLELLDRVKDVTLGAYAHQDVPFEKLVAELRPDRNLTRQPIFQVLLGLQNFPQETLNFAGLEWSWIEVEYLHSHFDLALHVCEMPDGLDGVFQYATDLFDAKTVARMAANLRVLLEDIASDPNRQIEKIVCVDPAENLQMQEWNDTSAPLLRTRCVHDLFEEQAELTPTAPAVIHAGQSLSYAELNAKSNQLARYLLNEGLRPSSIVGICLERGFDMVVGLLGILKAGAAYLPLDPNYPADRLRHMLKDAAPHFVLTHTKLCAVLPDTDLHVIALDSKLPHIAGYVPDKLPAADLRQCGNDLVYTIYTSGSTGRPKGTAMRHCSMVNLIEWHRRTLSAAGGRRVLQFAALGFDVAFQEIFSTLCTGGTLVMVQEWLRRDPRALLEFLGTHKIERLFVPPLMLQSLAEYADSNATGPLALQDVITAGEQLRLTPEICVLFEQLNGCRLHNHYGPTETHVVTALTLVGEPRKWATLPPIGRPIANTQIHLLDAQRRLVVIGAIGEIYISGACVARGYLNRPELTAERFPRDLFSHDPQVHMYRTGDLGRWRSDGVIEYLGRNDHQVKIRGFRIELGEIESHLARHAQVKDCVVIDREDTPGNKRLVAYVTRRGDDDPRVEDLRAHLKAVLPEYMVPSAFVTLEQLPLGANGKLNRFALPAPDMGAYVSRQYEAPQGQTEQALAEIWQELLRVERVGQNDNFFELGGHSLLGMKLVARVSASLGVSLSVVAMFQSPTIRQMAQVVDSLRSVAMPEPAFARRSAANLVPLTFSQLAHWHMYKLNERPSFSLVSAAVQLNGPLSLQALQTSLLEMVRRHEALRTRIVVHDGVPMQKVVESVDFSLTCDDLTGLPTSQIESEVRRLTEKYMLDSIAVTGEALFRFRLIRLRDEQHILVLAMEHIVSDGYSINVLLRETLQAYSQAARGCDFVLPTISVQFADYAAWQAGQSNSWMEQHGAYWTSRVAGLQRVRFPHERSSFAEGFGWGIAPFEIAAGLKVQLREWCRSRQTTLVMGIFTAYVGLVMRWCNISKGVILFQTDGRRDSNIENTIGYFASALYVYIELRESDTFGDLLSRVIEEYCQAHGHADHSYMESRVPRPEFTRNTCFNWVPQGEKNTRLEADAQAGSVTAHRLPFEQRVLQNFERDTEPMMGLMDTDEEVACGVYFPLSRFRMETMERFGRNFLACIQALVSQPGKRIRDIVIE